MYTCRLFPMSTYFANKRMAHVMELNPALDCLRFIRKYYSFLIQIHIMAKYTKEGAYLINITNNWAYYHSTR